MLQCGSRGMIMARLCLWRGMCLFVWLCICMDIWGKKKTHSWQTERFCFFYLLLSRVTNKPSPQQAKINVFPPVENSPSLLDWVTSCLLHSCEQCSSVVSLRVCVCVLPHQFWLNGLYWAPDLKRTSGIPPQPAFSHLGCWFDSTQRQLIVAKHIKSKNVLESNVLFLYCR